MGLADRDYMRQQPRRWPRWLPNLIGALIVIGLVALVLVVSHYRTADAPESVVGSPSLLGIPLSPSQPLYPRNDPWKTYLAPERVCPGGEARSAPVGAQERTMICLLNWARRRRGLPALPASAVLGRSSALKARDIAQCEDFAHEACGKEARAVADEAGYDDRAGWGENIYAGSSPLGSPRIAVDRWLNSPGHRENLFSPEWTEQGVALLRVRSFNRASDVAIWVSQFGLRERI
jgi:uncharacterized protein YkwD